MGIQHQFQNSFKIMDPRLILVFTICLTRGVLGYTCYAMRCSLNDHDEDKECVGLGIPGNLENTTECAFFPCMKATGTDSDTKEKIRLYYCGYDESFSNICEFEDKCGKNKLDFKFKSPDVPVVNVSEAKVCCCNSDDLCNISGELMEENSGTSLILNIFLLLAAFLAITPSTLSIDCLSV